MAGASKQDAPRAAASTRTEPALRPKSNAGAATEPAGNATTRAMVGAPAAGSDADWETF
jgi:hypothetical protein